EGCRRHGKHPRFPRFVNRRRKVELEPSGPGSGPAMSAATLLNCNCASPRRSPLPTPGRRLRSGRSRAEDHEGAGAAELWPHLASAVEALSGGTKALVRCEAIGRPERATARGVGEQVTHGPLPPRDESARLLVRGTGRGGRYVISLDPVPGR